MQRRGQVIVRRLVEYGIKAGKIGHLVSEYSGRNQEKAIPNTHKPANENTEFSIAFQDDFELKVKIAPNGTHTRAVPTPRRCRIGTTAGSCFGRTKSRNSSAAEREKNTQRFSHCSVFMNWK